MQARDADVRIREAVQQFADEIAVLVRRSVVEAVREALARDPTRAVAAPARARRRVVTTQSEPVVANTALEPRAPKRRRRATRVVELTPQAPPAAERAVEPAPEPAPPRARRARRQRLVEVARPTPEPGFAPELEPEPPADDALSAEMIAEIEGVRVERSVFTLVPARPRRERDADLRRDEPEAEVSEEREEPALDASHGAWAPDAESEAESPAEVEPAHS